MRLNPSASSHSKSCLAKEWLKQIGVCTEVTGSFRKLLIWFKILCFKTKQYPLKDSGFSNLEKIKAGREESLTEPASILSHKGAPGVRVSRAPCCQDIMAPRSAAQ